MCIMFKVNNKDTRTTQWRRSGVFIANLEDTFILFYSILLLILIK